MNLLENSEDNSLVNDYDIQIGLKNLPYSVCRVNEADDSQVVTLVIMITDNRIYAFICNIDYLCYSNKFKKLQKITKESIKIDDRLIKGDNRRGKNDSVPLAKIF